MNDKSDKDNEDFDALFRQAVKDVTPLKPNNRARHRPSPRNPPVRHVQSDTAELDQRFSESMLEPECPDHLYFERAGGLQKSVLKKLRAGKLHVDSIQDLHGLSVDEARRQLADFLQECHHFAYRHVIIIHGKGIRSQNRPVIKPMVNRWLRQADEVLAFCSAQPKDGGTGAVYVLLRKTGDA
jgi:DNA-nicking Smr family endonuclease